MARFKCFIKTDKIGSEVEDEIEIEDEELEGLEGDARIEKINLIVWDHMCQYIDCYSDEIEEVGA